MKLADAIKSLKETIGINQWFHDIVKGDNNTMIVLTSYQNKDVLETVPERWAGYRVLLHFYQTDKYKLINSNPLARNNDTPNLLEELEKLYNKHSINIINGVIFEIQDGEHAVTNLSALFPEVRTNLNKLVNFYGIDLVTKTLSNYYINKFSP